MYFIMLKSIENTWNEKTGQKYFGGSKFFHKKCFLSVVHIIILMCSVAMLQNIVYQSYKNINDKLLCWYVSIISVT